MTSTQLGQIELLEALRNFQEHRRLVALLHSMATELERVNEDNIQLRAAVKIYRELANRRSPNSPRAKPVLLRKSTAASL